MLTGIAKHWNDDESLVYQHQLATCLFDEAAAASSSTGTPVMDPSRTFSDIFLVTYGIHYF